MLRRLVVLLVLGLLVISLLAGCGGQKEEPAMEETTPATEQPTTTDTVTAPDTGAAMTDTTKGGS
jgi:hypothetical protein